MNPAHVSTCLCEDCRPPPTLDERETVELWRLRELIRAGYLVGHAERIAIRRDVDLHFAVELVTKRGCPVELAAEIVL